MFFGTRPARGLAYHTFAEISLQSVEPTTPASISFSDKRAKSKML
jgi:hypothetical protein